MQRFERRCPKRGPMRGSGGSPARFGGAIAGQFGPATRLLVWLTHLAGPDIDTGEFERGRAAALIHLGAQ